MTYNAHTAGGLYAYMLTMLYSAGACANIKYVYMDKTALMIFLCLVMVFLLQTHGPFSSHLIVFSILCGLCLVLCMFIIYHAVIFIEMNSLLG